MDRDRQSYRGWPYFLTGVFIGLVIVTPALAMPPDLPLRFDDDARLYVLIASGALLFAALVMRLMRNRDAPESVDLDAPRAGDMRYFPSDRPIVLE